MPMLAALHCRVFVMCMFTDHWVGSSQQQAQTRINQVLVLLLLLVVWVIMRLAANSTCCAGQCQWLQHATMNFSESDSGRLCLNPILYSRGLNKWPHLNNRLRAWSGAGIFFKLKHTRGFTPPPKTEFNGKLRNIHHHFPFRRITRNRWCWLRKSGSLREMQVNWHEFSCRSNKCRRPMGSISNNYLRSALNKCSVLPVVWTDNQFRLIRNKLKLDVMMNPIDIVSKKSKSL